MASRATAASAQRPVPVGPALALLTFAATTVCTISATNSLPGEFSGRTRAVRALRLHVGVSLRQARHTPPEKPTGMTTWVFGWTRFAPSGVTPRWSYGFGVPHILSAAREATHPRTARSEPVDYTDAAPRQRHRRGYAWS